MEYAHRAETRQEHLADLREIYGYKMFSDQGARDLKTWLVREAKTARSNLNLARRLVEQCRQTQTILPGISVVERLCTDALVAAKRKRGSPLREVAVLFHLRDAFRSGDIWLGHSKR